MERNTVIKKKQYCSSDVLLILVKAGDVRTQGERMSSENITVLHIPAFLISQYLCFYNNYLYQVSFK